MSPLVAHQRVDAGPLGCTGVLCHTDKSSPVKLSRPFFGGIVFLIFNFEIITDFHDVARKKVQGVPVYFDPVSLNDIIL